MCCVGHAQPLAAIASGHSGTSAPAYIAAGQHWWDTDTPGTGVWTKFLYDGTSSIAVGYLDTGAHVFVPANDVQAANIASATTTDIGAARGKYVKVTGTTTITGFGTVQAGTRRFLRFTGALTLTHNATSLILPGGANITTAAGDVAVFVSEGSGNWRCGPIQRANGKALIGQLPSDFDASVNWTTWTPTDESGATLTFSNVNAKYTRIGNLIFADFYLTFPSTANGAAITIGGLPVTVAHQTYAKAPTPIGMVGAGGSGALYAVPKVNTVHFEVRGAVGYAALVNSDLSTSTINGRLVYPAS